MQELEGRVAVVTGGASGIGRALAARFVAEGMSVVVADIEKGALDDAAAALGPDVLAVPTDVADRGSVDALAEAAVARFGRVHVLCNNAGVFLPSTGPLWETTEQEWTWILGVNLLGIVHGVQAFVPGMLAHGDEGHVVNTASLAGLLGFDAGGAYGPSKFAAVGYSEQLALELQAASDDRIGVSVLCPAWVRTRIVDADRNRPAELRELGDPDPATAAKRAVLTGQMEAGALAPEVVAAEVVDAIRTGRLFVTPNPEWNPAIRARTERIVTGGGPILPTPGA